MCAVRLPYNLNLLFVFAAVAETRSTTEAARRLNISQPAVSHALSRLRCDLRDPLFLRKGGGLMLTSRAKGLVGPVTQLVQDAQQIFKTPVFDPAASTQRFRIALSDYASITLAGKLSRALERQAPSAQLALDVVSGDSLKSLLEGELDAVVWRTADAAEPLRAQTIVRDTLAVVVDARHPLTASSLGSGFISVDDYVRYKHVQARLVSSRDPLVDTALERLGKKRAVAFCTNDYRAALDMLIGSELILTLPLQVLGRHGSEGIRVFPLPFPVDSETYDLVWDGRRDADPALKWFVSLVTNLGRELGEEGT